LAVLVKWRKLIAINFFIVCLIAAAFSLIMPQTYTAHTTDPATEKEGRWASLVSAQSANRGMGSAMSAMKRISFSRSEFSHHDGIGGRKVDLVNRYKVKNIEKAT
jgi:hypothetical protein